MSEHPGLPNTDISAHSQTHRVIAAVLRIYGRVELPASGDSMYPLIKDRDICTFEAAEPSDVRKGDIVLFADGEGRLVAHRFYRWIEKDGHTCAQCKGDANLGYDEPVPAERLIATLAHIRKRGAILPARHPVLALWGRVIVRSRYLSSGIRRYLNRQAAPDRCRTS